jgi:hypothetical protein
MMEKRTTAKVAKFGGVDRISKDSTALLRPLRIQFDGIHLLQSEKFRRCSWNDSVRRKEVYIADD